MAIAAFGALARGGERTHPEMEILSERDLYRVGEVVNLTVEGAPEGANVTWDFGDGTAGYGREVNHTYRRSAYYSIHATVVWEGEKGLRREVLNRTIEVRCRDIQMHWEGGRIVMLRPLWARGQGGGVPLYPGTTRPEASVEVVIHNAVGMLRVEVTLNYEVIAERSITSAGGDERVSFHLKEEIPPIEEESVLEVIIWVYEGAIAGWEMDITVTY